MADRTGASRGRLLWTLVAVLGGLLVAGAGTGLYVSGLMIDEYALTTEDSWSDPLWIGFFVGLALLAAGAIAFVVRASRQDHPPRA